MTTPQGLTLTAAHDVAQARLLNTGLAELTTIFMSALDPYSLTATGPGYSKAAAASVKKTRAQASALAQTFYNGLRGLETGAAGVRKPYAAVVPPGPVDALLETSMLVTGPIQTKIGMANGLSIQEALTQALTMTLGSATRHVEGGPRDVQRYNAKHDPLAHGWARRSGGVPCAFCAMLISRGPVYSEGTAGFRSHDHCHCKAVAFFGDDSGWTAQSAEFADLWRQSDGSLRDFTRVYRGKYPITKSPTVVHVEALSDNVLVNAAAEAAAVRAAQEAARAAAAAAVEAERIAAAEAERVLAELRAKEAAKQAALEKKWLGKPAPKAPVAPDRPASALAKAREAWLADVTARYDALGTGKPFSSSLNYGKVEQAKHGDLSALDFLKANKYVDDALYDAARAMWKTPDVLDAADEAVYRKALRSYKNLSTRHSRYMEEWRTVNGITTEPLKGLHGARTFTTNNEALSWANSKMHAFSAGAERNALKEYTGGSYRPWNRALRENADRGKHPKGWEEKTRLADSAMDKSVFPEDVIVYRGTGWDEFAFGNGSRSMSVPPPDPTSLIGTVQTQHGYMSTSVGTSSAFSGSVNMHIRVPAGHKGAYVDPFSNFKGEREIFLERSTNLFIHDVYKPPGSYHYVVEAEVIPAGANPEDYIGHEPIKRSSRD